MYANASAGESVDSTIGEVARHAATVRACRLQRAVDVSSRFLDDEDDEVPRAVDAFDAAQLDVGGG